METVIEQRRALTPQDRQFLLLMRRSEADDEGWTQASKVLWRLVVQFTAKELIEVDEGRGRIRFTQAGLTVVKYLG